MQGEGAVAGLQFAGAAAGGVGTAITQLASAVDAFDGGLGDAVVERIDHPAYRIAAIQQGGGAADDFDALHGHRVERHGVVVGQRRRIQGADAVAQNANAVAVQAADHRAAGAWAEPGRGDTGLFVQGFTEAALLLQQQVVAFEHCTWGGQLAVAQRVGGDHLGFEFNGLAGG
ncbi:hypothetical protein D3C79_901900 [compost metagenome]